MKNKVFLISLLFAITSCKKETYITFGNNISTDDVISTEDIALKYSALKEGDTLSVKFQSTIKEVCQKKGCWMTLDLKNDKEVFVKFKDYSFFVPKNAQNETVIVNGKAFVSIESVDELKHYAKDAGKSQESIDSIMVPKTTFSFLADGVLIKE
jgi:hypothetical protein